MTTRYGSLCNHPAPDCVAQLISDIVVIAWTTLWVLVAMAVHSAISTIAEVGRQVETGANGVSDNLDSAGDRADSFPLIGDALSKPLRAASEAALDIAGAGHSLDSTASWLAWLLALAVAAPPILAVAGPWLFLRVRFFRRKWTAITLASTYAGEQLLALRALANRPLVKLTAVSNDPAAPGVPRTPSRSAAWPPWSCAPPACEFGVASPAICGVSAAVSAVQTPQTARTGTDRRLSAVHSGCSTSICVNTTASLLRHRRYVRG